MNKWFKVSSNRSGSTHQLAGKAGFEDLGIKGGGLAVGVVTEVGFTEEP